MKPALMRILLALTLGVFSLPSVSGSATCSGKFANPITDICWSCVFPLTIAGASIWSENQEDTPNPSTAVCGCSNPPRVGHLGRLLGAGAHRRVGASSLVFPESGRDEPGSRGRRAAPWQRCL